MILNVLNSFDSSIEGAIPGNSFVIHRFLKFKSSEHVQENSSTLPSSGAPINDTLLLYREKTARLLPASLPLNTQTRGQYHNIKGDQSITAHCPLLTNN